MRLDKEEAFELRRQGKSYKQIKSLLGMSMAILSDWFKNEEWSKEIKSKLASEASAKNSYKLALMHKARRKQLDLLYEKAREEARKEYVLYRQDTLFIAGIMIYWGEGDKRSENHCGIANTEPKMIRVFVKFLTEVCNVSKDKIRAWILLYPDLDDKECRNYWTQMCGLEEKNFVKSITIQGRSTVRRLHYGVCNVGFHNRYFKEKMLIWLMLASTELVGLDAGIV